MVLILAKARHVYSALQQSLERTAPKPMEKFKRKLPTARGNDGDMEDVDNFLLGNADARAEGAQSLLPSR
jgi:hypothetical protein